MGRLIYAMPVFPAYEKWLEKKWDEVASRPETEKSAMHGHLISISFADGTPPNRVVFPLEANYAWTGNDSLCKLLGDKKNFQANSVSYLIEIKLINFIISGIHGSRNDSWVSINRGCRRHGGATDLKLMKNMCLKALQNRGCGCHLKSDVTVQLFLDKKGNN